MTKIKKSISWIAVVVIVAAAGYFIFKNKDEKTEYIITPVSRGTIIKTVSADGEYLSKEEADVSFRITGPITEMRVDVGDRVEEGQFLASIDEGTLVEKLEQAQKEVAAQKATYAYMKKHDSTYKYEQREAQRKVIEGAQAAVDEVAKQIQYAKITTPMSGIVAERKIGLGEIATATVPVITIIKEDEMRIEAKVPEVEIADVKVGQEAEVKFDAFPENRKFKAVILEIDPAPITVQNVNYYVVKIKIDNPDSGLKYGMSCTIYDKVGQKDNILMIPKGVVEKENGKNFVTVMANTEEKTLEKREIQTGMGGDGGKIEVISGLKEGDQIATDK